VNSPLPISLPLKPVVRARLGKRPAPDRLQCDMVENAAFVSLTCQYDMVENASFDL
jgi:hypothetical protein